MFQSTFPRGERRNVINIKAYSCRFQSTFPRGERRVACCLVPVVRDVSIHVPARGTTVTIASCTTVQAGFNPRSREGNDDVVTDFIPYAIVSIHVPARGTTLYKQLADDGTIVSIHVPARGTTFAVCILIPCFKVSIHVPARGTTEVAGTGGFMTKFQSTFPRGERLLGIQHTTIRIAVSIHVPARGTTKIL